MSGDQREKRRIQPPARKGMLRERESLDMISFSPLPRRVKAVSPPVAVETDDGAEVSVVWKRVTLVLELCERVCHSVVEAHTLLPVLFGLLSRCVRKNYSLGLPLPRPLT